MDKTVEDEIAINLSSLVNSHEEAFVVIDKGFNILAVNNAYERLHNTSDQSAIGRKCYQVSHKRERPCGEDGEECPHEYVFKTGEAKVCTHIHCDGNHNLYQVKVSAFPLKDANNEIFLGESIEQIASVSSVGAGSKQMVGKSAPFTACINQLDIAASSDAPVLLQGETGTGKELAAEYIHNHSSRCDKPFQIVDSSVLTESLFEAEMFGQVAGVYNDSAHAKQGLFELAEGGTIFLDEISDMPLSLQAKLLRVLENGEYRPVGGKNLLRADVRIISATNRHLWESVLAGKFREDLYYRIACLNIRLPGLRERIDDIPELTQNLLEGINRSMHSSYHLLPDVFDRLKQYDYPGNVRELRNILFIAATQSQDREINASLVNQVISNMPHCKRINVQQSLVVEENTDTKEDSVATLKSMEEKHIRELLDHYKGNRKKVAEALGISERTIYRKLKRLEII